MLMTKHPLYQIYVRIKRQCYNKNAKDYIGCDFYWHKKPKDFIDYWEENGWEKGLTIVRKSIDLPFSPENTLLKPLSEIRSKNFNSQKSKKTMIKKYGCHYTQTEEYKEKVKNTSLEKYGVKHYSQSNTVKEKVKKTNLDKYGVECVLSSNEIKEKIKNTNIKVRGVEYPSQDKRVVKKIQDTMIKNGNMYYFEDKNSSDWAEIIGMSRSGINARIRKYGYEQACSMDKRSSAIEQLISSMLDESNIKYVTHYKIEDKIADFLIEDRIVLEADGLYWHSDAINKDKNYHKNKRQLYLDNGFFPLFFREDEIENKINIIKSILFNKIGRNTQRIFARKCKIKSEGPIKKFLNENHLMGFGSGKAKFLYFENKPVAILQYREYKDYIDISRYCCNTFFSIVGGFSRLLSALPKKEIRTFIDLRYGSGKYLNTLGFTLSKSSLSFKWVKDNKTYHRLRFRGNSGYNNNMFKIWDCGQALYVKQQGLKPQNVW